MGSQHKIIPKARELGMTEQAYLRQLCATHTKFTSMALEVGCSHVAIIRAMQKYGMTKPRSTAFEYDGQLLTMRDHCRRLGLSHGNVSQNKLRHGFSGKEAIEHAFLCKNISRKRQLNAQASDSCHVEA